MHRYLFVLVCLAACSSQPTEVTAPAKPSEEAVAPTVAKASFVLDDQTLLLSQAQFEWVEKNGRRVPTPGPAKLMLLRRSEQGFQKETLLDPDSRVFHKAACVQDEAGLGLLTIGGTDAHLKRWTYDQGSWRSEKWWSPKFGGKWDRLRDFEIGDVDGDGVNDIVIATHDQGVIAVIRLGASGWEATQIYAEPDTFVHEIELGDSNGDGQLEIFATPSKPNKSDRSQPGRIIQLVWNAKRKKFATNVVKTYQKSHCKEILAADVDQDGKSELYAAIEAARGSGASDPLRVVRMTPKKKKWREETVAEINDGIQARVLLHTQVHPSGKELVVTTMKGGIWRLTPGKKTPWKKHLVEARSSGFELAGNAFDLDGDGANELYASADDQDEVVQIVWKEDGYQRERIASLEKSDLTWNIDRCVAIPLKR